jgi:hypothetical protein
MNWNTPRRLRTIGAAVGCAAVLAFASFADAQEWTTQDVLDNRIDVDAQYALMRMMTPRDYTHHMAGSAILSAVKDGDIGGVYQADRGVPAQRARSVGGDWWTIVPKGLDATCYKAGAGAPIIVYRKGIGGTQERLDPALRSAWESCGIPPAEPRPYRETIQKPPPPPSPPPPGVDPAPAAGLTVHVVNTSGEPVQNATVDTTYAAGGGDSADTDASGTVSFGDVPEGIVDIYVTGPENCTDDAGQFEMAREPLTITSTLDCTVTTPPTPPACNVDKFHEVFNKCGLPILAGAAKCTLGTYTEYAKCAAKRDPVCAAKVLAKKWKCLMDNSYKKHIQTCTDNANAASNCNFPGPQ